MRLFSNRSQKTSKCGKNISDTLGCASCAAFLSLPHFDVICYLSLNRRRLCVITNGKIEVNRAAAILVCKSKHDLGKVSKLPRGGERSWEAAGKIGVENEVLPLLVQRAFGTRDGEKLLQSLYFFASHPPLYTNTHSRSPR